jgi:hypothetical protein
MGAHENFQVRGYDAGESQQQASLGQNANEFWYMMNCLKCFEV